MLNPPRALMVFCARNFRPTLHGIHVSMFCRARARNPLAQFVPATEETGCAALETPGMYLGAMAGFTVTYASTKARPTARHDTHQKTKYYPCTRCHVVRWLWPPPEKPGLLGRLLAEQSLDSFLVKVQRGRYCRAGVENPAENEA